MRGEAPEERCLVLHWVRSNKQDAVLALRHGRALGFWRDARRPCGSLSDSTGCPAVEYNPFSDVSGCAKLPSFRRGLRFTVSLRTGAVFLGDRTSVRVMFGSDTAAVECGRKSAGVL